MYRYKQVWQVAFFNFRQWKNNPRVAITFVLAFIMCMMLCDKAISFANSYGTTMQIMEAFVWTFGDASSIMISSLLLVLLFSDMPFITAVTPYYLSRTKKSVWMWGQVVYVILATILYVLFLLLITVALCAHISFAGNMWSETGALLGYSGIGIKVALPASLKTMEMSLPYQCAAWIFLLVLLYSLLTVTLMMVFNMKKSSFMGILSVFILNLYGLLLNPQIFVTLFNLPQSLQYKANVVTGWLSPLNHATYYMHNFGYDYLPRLGMSCILFLIFILLHIFMIWKSIKKYEFNFLQIND